MTFMIHFYNCFLFTTSGREGGLNPGSPYEKNCEMPPSHKALGFMYITVACEFIYQFVVEGKNFHLT
jgi:hypothetical protein